MSAGITLENQLRRLEILAAAAASDFLSVEMVAVMTGWSKKTIYNKVNRHALTAYKPDGKEIFFKKADLNRYILRNPILSEEDLKEKSLTLTR